MNSFVHRVLRRIRYDFYRVIDCILRLLYRRPMVLTPQETLRRISVQHLSVSRFGDGEMALMDGKGLNFQDYDPLLAQKLNDTFKDGSVMVCVPPPLSSFEGLKEQEISFWKNHLYFHRFAWYSRIDYSREYGNTWISRFYSPYIETTHAEGIVELYRKLWDDRDLIVIEGEFSRLGVGNSLFLGARSVKRILCPSKNAFAYYDDIFKHACMYENESLYILALGPTATVLARDLAYTGRQALDLGHLDLEYVWYLSQVTYKAPVRGKFSNEAFLRGMQTDEVEGDLTPEEEKVYSSQIVGRVGV